MTLPVTIRRAAEKDFEPMLAITHAALRQIAVSAYPLEEIEEAIATGAWTLNRSLLIEGNYFVAEREGTILGGAGWDRTWLGPADTELDRPASLASLRGMFVSPKAAGHGYGSALLTRCLDDIRDSGINTVELYASFNAEALYEKHGFRKLALQSLVLESGAVMKGSRMRKTFA